jgi:rRNA-processing protein FCF1
MGKLLRQKEARKTLRFFRLSFGATPPYAILLDGNALHASVGSKIDLQHRLRNMLQREAFTLFVPGCVRPRHLYLAKPPLHRACV